MEKIGPIQLVQGSEIDFISLFLQSGPVVKTVMIGLMLASVICWAIILEKTLSLWWAGRADRKFLQRFRAGIKQPNGKSAAGRLLANLLMEFSRAEPNGGLRDQITSRIALELGDVSRRREAGLSVLATVASTAPFVGLFGTVWGIINSFAAIAGSKNTSLAVVAPGIAEALLATAMGLLAAIPAAVFYNRLNLTVTGSLQTLEALGHEVLIRVARQQPLDFQVMKAVNHSSGLGSGFLPRRAQLSSEINVTPFVDVMLVLLIIFMVAAPLMTVGLPVDLPQASLNELEQETEPLNVIIAPDGIVHLGETEITKDHLAATLAAMGEEARQQRVRIRADRIVTYEDIMFVMSALSESGFTRIGLMATPKTEDAAP